MPSLADAQSPAFESAIATSFFFPSQGSDLEYSTEPVRGTQIPLVMQRRL